MLLLQDWGHPWVKKLGAGDTPGAIPVGCRPLGWETAKGDKEAVQKGDGQDDVVWACPQQWKLGRALARSQCPPAAAGFVSARAWRAAPDPDILGPPWLLLLPQPIIRLPGTSLSWRTYTKIYINITNPYTNRQGQYYLPYSFFFFPYNLGALFTARVSSSIGIEIGKICQIQGSNFNAILIGEKGLNTLSLYLSTGACLLELKSPTNSSLEPL